MNNQIPNWIMVLSVISSLLWTVTYILGIINGFKQKTYCFPALAILINLSWEIIFSFFFNPNGDLQQWLYRCWFVFDLVIFYQLLKYADPGILYLKTRIEFLISILILLILVGFGLYFFILYYGDTTGTESAFIDNLIMSILFIFFAHKREFRLGITLSIAGLKFLGTLFVSIAALSEYPSIVVRDNYNFLYYIIFLITAIDILYLLLVFKKQKDFIVINHP